MPHSRVPTTTLGQRIGDYVLGTSIGQGACSKVRLARHVPTDTQVVIKSIVRRDVSRELRCLRNLQHKNIACLLEVVATPNEFHLVMEHVRGGDLREYLQRRGRLTEREARTVFRQVFLALRHCHGRGFAHRDIKPDNILLEEDLTAKLADFGFCRETIEGLLITGWCGTLSYMAPEVLMREPYDAMKADVWGLGISLYKTVTGRVPFPGNCEEKVIDRILEGRYTHPYYMSEEGRSFLQRLLSINPDRRPTLEEAIRMPWLELGPEDLPPHCEPLWEDLDPHVVEAMRGFGFDEEEIRVSVAGRTFDRVMGTYRILLMTMGRMGMGRMPGRTIQVRPCWPPDTGAGPPSSLEESWASGGSSGPSVASPPCPCAKNTSAPPPSLKTTASSSLPLEPVQALQPGGSPKASTVRPPCLGGVKNTCAPPPPPPPSLETIASSSLPLEPVQALQPEGSPSPPTVRPPCLGGVKNICALPPLPPPSLLAIAPSPLPLEPVQALQPGGSPSPPTVRPLCLGVVKNTCAPPPPPPSLLAIAPSPLPLEPVQALQPGTRGPAPQLLPGGAPTPRTSIRFRSPESQAVQVENPEGAPPDSSPQEGSLPASPAANTRARPGLVRRAWKTFLKVFCCGVDTTKPRRKTTRARSGNT